MSMDVKKTNFTVKANNVSLSKSGDDKYLNTIHPNYTMNTPNVSKETLIEDMLAITAGTYDDEKVEAFGITHYQYHDCDEKFLCSAGSYGGKKIEVHEDCYNAFKKMRADAAKAGHKIFIISGFRSERYQVDVFKRKFKDENYPTPEEFKSRLKFSAPPGFSEHHTGLAIDINSLEQNFKDTKEYAWLKVHAAEYGFEMSFPENNNQGLGFEPWHWRFVGKEETNPAREVFRAARENR